MSFSVAVLGLGASGLAAVRDLVDNSSARVSGYDPDPNRRRLADEFLTGPACDRFGSGSDIVVLATPAGTHIGQATDALSRGSSVVSMGDRPSDVVGLLDLDSQASGLGLTVVVGAGMAPGLSCLLASHAASRFDSVEEILISKTGTGGPACARQHHRALKRSGRDRVDGQWILRTGGSGRDLAWFPDPIGAKDCYRGSLPDPHLLNRAFPDCGRISARVSATRRDRLTSRLPMLRKPHADGGPGAVRVEVRGIRQGAFETTIYGVMADPSRAAGLMASISSVAISQGLIGQGATGLAELADPISILKSVTERGLRVETLVGY